MVAAAFLPLTAAAQAKRPTLMVLPADSWCSANGFMKTEKGRRTPDYERAWQESQDLYGVVTKIGELMSDRGFPLKSMAMSLKSMGRAQTDIFLEVGWKVNQTGPRRSVTYTLAGLDAYTMKQIAAGSGTGVPSFSTELPVLLEEAVVEHMDNFAAQLQAHFDDLLQNGREVSVGIRVAEGSKLTLAKRYDGTELTDAIDDWMARNTVEQRYSLSDATDTQMAFEQVRIPLYTENGMPMDTRRFVNGLRKMLSEAPYNIPSKIETDGLGRATLLLGIE